MCIYISMIWVLFFKLNSFHLYFSLGLKYIQNVLKDNLEDAIYLIFEDNKIYSKLNNIMYFIYLMRTKMTGAFTKTW